MRASALQIAAPAFAPRWRMAAIGVAVPALVLGFLATPAAEQAEAVRAAGPELTRLLRMMAGLKLAFVAAGIGFAWWRLGHAIRPSLAGAYLASVAAVCVAPGLIWDMAHVVTGAALLHGGLGALLTLGWFDRDLRGPIMSRIARGRGEARIARHEP